MSDWLPGSLEAIRGRTARVTVLGCGYVGLTLAVACARAGFRVLGVEADEARCKDLAAGVNPVPDVDIPGEELVGLESLRFAGAPEGRAEVVVLCVPTPLRDGTPDLTFVEAAADAAGTVVVEGGLVVLESTTYPGTTEELLRPIVERVSGLRRDATSPSRTPRSGSTPGTGRGGFRTRRRSSGA